MDLKTEGDEAVRVLHRIANKASQPVLRAAISSAQDTVAGIFGSCTQSDTLFANKKVVEEDSRTTKHDQRRPQIEFVRTPACWPRRVVVFGLGRLRLSSASPKRLS